MRLFKKKDPICGMKEEKGKGMHKHGKWFCNKSCLEEYETKTITSANKKKKGGCCGNCH